MIITQTTDTTIVENSSAGPRCNYTKINKITDTFDFW